MKLLGSPGSPYVRKVRIVLAEKHIIAFGAPANVLAVEHPFIKQFFHGERGQRALEGLRDPPETAHE